LTVRFPLASKDLLLATTVLVVPLKISSSVSGRSFSTMVGSGVGARFALDDGKLAPAPGRLRKLPPPPPPPMPPSMEKMSSSNPPLPAPPPADLVNSRKISSALLKLKPWVPPPGPVEKWNVRVPPPLGMPPKLNPPGIPPLGPAPAPPPPPGDGAGPPRSRYSRPN
jgi:hypothetical protein